MAEKNPKNTQSQQFKMAARELGCDESEERFAAALKRVARHKPQPKVFAKKTKPKKGR
jgi:hypothetical protein